MTFLWEGGNEKRAGFRLLGADAVAWQGMNLGVCVLENGKRGQGLCDELLLACPNCRKYVVVVSQLSFFSFFFCEW